MPIESVSIKCRTIARNDNCNLQIGIGLNQMVTFCYGLKPRDIFIIDRKDFISALEILGFLEK